MRLPSHRRNLVVRSQSVGSVGRYCAPPFTRTRRIHRWIRTGVLLLPGLMFLAFALLVPASPKSDHMRRSELERELAVFSHPAQRRLAIQAMAAHDHRFPVTGRY